MSGMKKKLRRYRKLIAVVGSSNADIVLKVDHFTKPGETQKAFDLSFFPGGKGANQAVTVARVGGEGCYFVTCLGNDEYGRVLSQNFLKNKIEGFLFVDEPTGRAFIEVTKNGDNRIIIFQGANASLTKDKINWKELLKGHILLLQNEIPFETTLECARKFRGLVIFDPAPVEGITEEIFSYVDFLTPNEEELKALAISTFGEFVSIEDSAKKFLKKGVGSVLVKLGRKGVVLFSDKDTFHVPGFEVKTIDTTAAGDVFNGAFAVALEEGKTPKEAMVFANAAAAISVTRAGAQSSIPDRKEIEEFLKVRL